MKVVFFNIAYMEKYNGTEAPQGHFRYVRERNDATEKYTFEPIDIGSNRYCLGYVETGFTKGGFDHGGKNRIMHIERIEGVFKNQQYADNVLVVWCANLPQKGSAVIGWYQDAKVYGKYITFSSLDNGGEVVRNYNVISQKDNCVLLPPQIRTEAKWYAPRKNQYGYGFGQSNMWYAREKEAEDYVSKVVKNINNYSGPNYMF